MELIIRTTSFQLFVSVLIGTSTLLCTTSDSQLDQWSNIRRNNSFYWSRIRPRFRPRDTALPRGEPYYYEAGHGERYRMVVVDQSGHGDFTKVQDAIDSVPSDNRFWVHIQINSGTYREKVSIGRDKPYIMLKGQGRRWTKIVWDDHSDTSQSPTFKTEADNIVVRGIHFVNSYNYPRGKNQIMPAVAVLVSGDKTSFYGCRFSGVQDTLWDNEGRHYFKRCTIEGAVDFIFGGGQSIYEDCDIRVIGGGFITAQSRETLDDPSGFVFKECSVSGTGPTYLGRPWRQYARVLFFKCHFSDVVDPKGWNPWIGDMSKVTYSEYGNYGPGADTSKRVIWEKKLPVEMWEEMTSISYINGGGWLEEQPN
ncbi:Probable pectinesterase 29 [Linum perenne]